MYIGVNHGFHEVEVSGDSHLNSTYFPTTLGITFGKNFNKNFGLEATIGLGLSDNSLSTSALISGVLYDVERTIKIKDYFGGYAVGILPINEKIKLFGKAGLAIVNAEQTIEIQRVSDGASSSRSDSESKSGFSYGLGGSWELSDNHGVTAEYVKLPELKSGGISYKVSSINIGYRYSF